MNTKRRLVIILLAITVLISAVTATAKKPSKAQRLEKENSSTVNPVLWRSPGDIRSRNLFFVRRAAKLTRLTPSLPLSKKT